MDIKWAVIGWALGKHYFKGEIYLFLVFNVIRIDVFKNPRGERNHLRHNPRVNIIKWQVFGVCCLSSHPCISWSRVNSFWQLLPHTYPILTYCNNTQSHHMCLCLLAPAAVAVIRKTLCASCLSCSSSAADYKDFDAVQQHPIKVFISETWVILTELILFRWIPHPRKMLTWVLPLLAVYALSWWINATSQRGTII